MAHTRDAHILRVHIRCACTFVARPHSRMRVSDWFIISRCCVAQMEPSLGAGDRDETTSDGAACGVTSTVEEPTSAPAVVVPPANGGASNMDVGVEQSLDASNGIADDAIPAPPPTPEASPAWVQAAAIFVVRRDAPRHAAFDDECEVQAAGRCAFLEIAFSFPSLHARAITFG